MVEVNSSLQTEHQGGGVKSGRTFRRIRGIALLAYALAGCGDTGPDKPMAVPTFVPTLTARELCFYKRAGESDEQAISDGGPVNGRCESADSGWQFVGIKTEYGK